jgi:hypothetical protein
LDHRKISPPLSFIQPFLQCFACIIIILHLVSVFFPPSFVWTKQIIIHFGITTSIIFGDIFVQLNTIFLLLLPSSNMTHTRFFVLFCFFFWWNVVSFNFGVFYPWSWAYFHLFFIIFSTILIWSQQIVVYFGTLSFIIYGDLFVHLSIMFFLF